MNVNMANICLFGGGKAYIPSKILAFGLIIPLIEKLVGEDEIQMDDLMEGI